MFVGSEAWITSAVDDKYVNKAITLAASLKRVRTGKKLVVLTSLAVANGLRYYANPLGANSVGYQIDAQSLCTVPISDEQYSISCIYSYRVKLKEAFDLVLLLDPITQNGWSHEDYAKLHAFSLDIFNKCVYLSPNFLVLKNCDEIFGAYSKFGASVGQEHDIDSSIYVFAPCTKYSKFLATAAQSGGVAESNGDFNLWLTNQVPNVEELDEKYNLRLELNGDLHPNPCSNASIVNFVDCHPLDLQEDSVKSMFERAGVIEKFAIDYCREIYVDTVKKASSDSGGMPYNERYMVEPTAIVGMSFRLPGGNNVDEFWTLLKEGRNAVVPVPSHRWTKEHSLILCKNRNLEAGFVNFPLDQFDAKFFSLSPKEAEFLDPQQRLLLEVTWEALEDAMIDPFSIRGSKTGVFVGSWIHDYKDICYRSVDVDYLRTYMGNSIAATAARLSHFFETTGPSIATESGCSSAIAAVDMACKSLRSRDSDIAVAAGVNLLLHSFEDGMLEFLLSPDFRCKTFDADANGFARAEGCASIILKRLSDAVRDGDNIWGLIRGTALTQEGVSRSLGTPTVQCESMAMELALQDACVEPSEVSYIEAHGTGTAVGDPMEILAINKVYSIGRKEPLVIGSVKTNVGHTESVSGLTGIIKVLLSLKNEMIPKHLNFNTLNPEINLDAIPAQLPMEPVPWPKISNKPRIAGVSSFGISGTDGHAIIEEAPDIPQLKMKFDQERPLHIMKLSAKSSESFDEIVQNYYNIFKGNLDKRADGEEDFANLAYSANIGRATFNHRAVIVAKNFREATKMLGSKSFKQADIQSASKSLCFLFTGQGSQYAEMGKQLYETSPVFRDTFEKCDELLQQRYNISIRDVLWLNDKDLGQTLYSQTSIFVIEYCLLKLWESWGVKPDYVMGHSLGEFAAAVAARALSLEDALMLVAERSRLIDSLPRGKMLVIEADKRWVDEAISVLQKGNPHFWMDYAALNSSNQTVVAGESGMIEELETFCIQKSIKTFNLAATHAFHSRQMEPMLDAYKSVASTAKPPEMKEGFPKFISGMEGKFVAINEIDADYWVRHTREKVNYINACKAIQDEGCTLFLEVGPHPVLSALTMMNHDGISEPIKCFPSIRKKENEWVTILDSLSKLYLSDWRGDIDWKGFDRFYSREKVKLPFYPFSKKQTWTKFEGNYSRIHPLIGSFIPCAKSDTIFQSFLVLKCTKFVQDHVIGNTCVFPGAGFLEMCLAGGYCAAQGLTEDLMKPKRPVSLKALKVLSPLALYESSICKMQTLVALNDKCGDGDDDSELGYSVQVHRQQQNADGTGLGQWIQHASATFSPVVPILGKDVFQRIDIKAILSTWENKDNKDFYEKLPEVGLRFGPIFQSLVHGWKSEEGILTSLKIPEDCREYIIHPVVADAMIQTIMLWTSKGEIKKKLQVPLQIGEFILLQDVPQSKNIYAYASSLNSVSQCILVDEDGTPLALMRGVDFIETTAKLVETMITHQAAAIPKLWEEVWVRSRGPMQGYLQHVTSPEGQAYSDEDLRDFEKNNKVSESEHKHYINLVNISRLSILKALYSLGWKPELGDCFSIDFLMATCNIQEHFRQYICFFIQNFTLQETSWLCVTDEEENTFQIVGTPPSIDEIEEGVMYVTSPNDVTQEDYRLLVEVHTHLVKILVGEMDPLRILFPENAPASTPSAAKCYQCLASKLVHPRHFKKASIHMSMAISHSLARPTYRCLEVGGGSAAFTEEFLSLVYNDHRWEKVDLEFYFTDVSSVFFAVAEKSLEKYSKNIVFKKFDMEKDPLEQGYCPGYFDMITAAEVLHIAKNLKKTMRSLRSLLKPGGLLHFIETTCPDPRITFIFGLLDGYWHFEDRELRKNHACLSVELWESVLLNSGFNGVSVVQLYSKSAVITAHACDQENNFLRHLYPEEHSWIIFGEHDDWTELLLRKFQNVNRKCVIVPKPTENPFDEIPIREYLKKALTSVVEEMNGGKIEGILYLWSLCPKTRDQAKVSLPLLTLMQLIAEMKFPPKLFPVVRGAHAMKSYDVVDPTPGTLVGLCRTLANENTGMRVSCLDLDPHMDLLNQNEELFMNLWVEHTVSSAFRDGLRFRPKLVRGKFVNNEPLSLPNGCDRFQLVLPKTKLISDLEFTYLQPFSLEDNQVEIQVKAVGLNFRDVFAVLKPIKQFENVNTVGSDCAGVITRLGKNVKKFKVGDKVVGVNFLDEHCFPSHLKTYESSIIPIQTGWSFAESVTLPTVFATTIFCLVKVAKIKEGDTILPHAASGGVGLVAIQLCQQIGANIIATAGSHRKRTYLRSCGVEHVFNSRTLDFKESILKVTGGRGVDIVLNSLTGVGFKEASLDVVCENGKFIEMSKLNIWTPEEVNVIRPDVTYNSVDLSTLNEEDFEDIIEELGEFIDEESVQPIPYERFDALNIRGALNYLQKANHIGKIVCIMPEVKSKDSQLVTTTPIFNEESTYIVTGGLGGIGYEVVKWILQNGGKHVAILSRSSPSIKTAEEIEKQNKFGKHVQAFLVDVGEYKDLKRVFKDLPSHGFPPLRGIMHAAGVLKNATLDEQSWRTFQLTYKSKVDGSWNLHELTKNKRLEHFVLFSSIAANVGLAGQGNHSASNSFEDSFAAYRRSIGLPATCINWANWGEVGVATEVDLPGLHPISTTEGLLALQTCLTTNTNHMMVMNVDSFAPMAKLFPILKSYVGDTRLLGDSNKSVLLNSDEFWKEVDSATDRDEKIYCFKKFIKIVIQNILKMDRDDPIDDTTEFRSLGIDSLMMLEMKNNMQNIIGSRFTLTTNQLKDCKNTELLANRLVDILEDNEMTLPSHEELLKLIRDDSNLISKKIVAENLKRPLITEIRTVLLTGGTGSLGPYLLSNLTKRSQIWKVYCLIRPSEKTPGQDRLKTRLQQVKITDTVDWSKVEIIEGDVTKSGFGLQEDVYESLCETVEAIIHNAALIDYSAKYWKAPETEANHVRTVNVLGTLRVLQFAAKKTLKHVFYSSTLSTYTGTGKLGQSVVDPRRWQDISAFDLYKNAVNAGYLLSKHISEQLVHTAIASGVPCKAFRFPVITGDSKTGRTNYEKSYAHLRWIMCMKIGAIHDVPVPLITFSVDHCAQTSLDIFFNPHAPYNVYNIVTKKIVTEQVLVDVAKNLGLEIKVIQFQEFINALKAENDTSPIAPFTKLYIDVETNFTADFENPAVVALKKVMECNENLLDTSELTKYAGNCEHVLEEASYMLTRDFEYLRDKGVLEKYGIKACKANST